MSEEEQLKKMRLEILGDSTSTTKDELFKLMLESAKFVALDTLYPYNQEMDALTTRQQHWQVDCAKELYKRLGTSGVQSYSEGGMNVSFLKGLLPDEIMNRLSPPKIGVPK